MENKKKNKDFVNDISEYKAKVKLLKQGLIEERKKNQVSENENQILKIRLNSVQQNLLEAEKVIQKMAKENEALKKQLIENKISSQSLGGKFTNVTTKTIEEENAKLLIDNELLKSENENLAEKFEESQNLMQTVIADKKKVISKYQEEIDEFSKVNSQLNQNLLNIQKQQKHNEEKYNDFLKLQMKLDNELNEKNMIIEDLLQQYFNNNEKLEISQKYIEEAQTGLLNHEKENRQMAELLVDLKEKLNEYDSYQRSFIADKSGFLKTKVYILKFARDKLLNYNLELTTSKKKKTFLVKYIEMYLDSKENKFILEITSKKKYFLYSVESLEIVESFHQIKANALQKEDMFEFNK